MKELILSGPSTANMTSLEISELVESRHDKVKQTIERLAKRGTISLPPMGEVKIQRERREETVSVYLLDKRSSLVVVAQLSPEFTARVVDRWQELEDVVANQPQNNFQLPATYAEALRLLADESEKTAVLQLTLAEQAPLVQLATAISSSPKSIKIGDYVQVISSQAGFIIGRNNFYEWLRFERILKKDNSPFQGFIDNGWFEVRESTYEHKNTNGPQVCFTTLITGKGQVSVLSRFKKSEYFQKFLNKSARVNSLNNAVPAMA